ncbi:MAG: sugar phosphate nucleotidyltransferase [Dehalococcoidales bacterium]|nr:sugar phosphate nucleotidyltransferase [Dehalococcoidales bacterium]
MGNNVITMILAGGRGKRMDILCYMRPKPALPFAGSFRVMDFTLSNCLHSGMTDIAVLTDYQRSFMANYLRRWQLANMNGGAFHILEPADGNYRGTADAVYQNREYLHKYDNALLLAGDHIYKMDYRKMLAFHEQSQADVTVSVVRVPVDQAQRFGIVKTNSDGRITSFTEKPRTLQGNLASMGIYIFRRDVLERHLAEDAGMAESTHDFGFAVLPRMINRDRVYAYEFNGYWQDIGTKEAYYAANMELLRPRPSFSMDSNWHILTEGTTLPPPQITARGSIINSVVNPGCVVLGRVENSILSPGVWVDHDATVRNSVVMSNTFIGFHSVVDRCIIDEDVNIGKLCYIGFGNSPRLKENDITVLGRDVTVPSNTAIGRNCKISPGVRPADFTTSMVTSHTMVFQRASSGNIVPEEALAGER